MSRTFRLSGIFLISVVSLQIFRIIFSYIPLSDNLSSWLFSFVFQVGCLGLVPYLLYRAFITKDPMAMVKDFRLNSKIAPISWLFAVIVGLLVFYLNTGVSTFWYAILNSWDFTYVSAPGTIYSSPEVLILEIITSAMLPAIFEEFTDRGLLLAVFAEEKSDTKKIVMIGIIFGLIHQNVAQLTPTMFGGLVMAYMAVKGASILPCMIVHFINNFLIIILQYSSQQPNPYIANMFYGLLRFNPLFTMFSYILAAGLLVFFLKRYASVNHENRNKLYPEETLPVPSLVIREAVKPEVSFDDIYGTKNGESTEPLVFTAEHVVIQPVLAKRKVRTWDYALLYCAMASTALVTFFTYLWGLWR